MPCPSPGDLLNPGIESWSLALQADSLPSELQGSPKGRVTGDVVLDRMAREAFSEVVTYEQRHKPVGLSGSSQSQAQGTVNLKVLRQI